MASASANPKTTNAKAGAKPHTGAEKRLYILGGVLVLWALVIRVLNEPTRGPIPAVVEGEEPVS